MKIIKKKFIVRCLMICLLLLCFKPIQAQQTNIDTILALLQQSKTNKGVDTSKFADAENEIVKSPLTDSDITVLEQTGNTFVKDKDEYLSYRLRFSILNSLIANNKDKAIRYGKQNMEALKKSTTPNHRFISSAFLRQLRLPYRNSNMLSEGFQYFNEKLKEYKLNKDSIGLADCYYVLGGFYRTIGLLGDAIYNMKKSISCMREHEKPDNEMFFFNPIGRLMWLNNISVLAGYYLQKGDYRNCVEYARIPYNETIRTGSKQEKNTTTTLAMAKILAGQLDSAKYYLDQSFGNTEIQKQPDYMAFILQIRALYFLKTGELDKAESDLHKSWKLVEENKLQPDARSGSIGPDYYMALVRIKQNRLNDAIALLIKDIARLQGQRLFILRDYKLLGSLQEQTGKSVKAAETFKSYISLQDSVLADQSKFQSMSFETEQSMNEKELSITKLENENKISAIIKNFSFGIVALVLLLAGVLYYRFKSKQKANKLLEQTLSDLKSTQSQLIQSEKMASLGELTAGIAHEIQNPLNFVNNFSDVNQELLVEMKDEIEKGNSDEAKAIANDVIENEQKINHHGKRADAIVKGMLQHSRKSSGQKEPTDINALADEYLRLSYHGLRAKDKTFNAEIKTDFDGSIGKIEIIPQDIGRVLLNLFNNAFYAVNARLNESFGQEQKTRNSESYKPIVSVTTKKYNDKVQIIVKDNGNGIPQNIVDKIFQPFFTTKPTGEGTGLGLSLAYDIVKAHGGELKVGSKEGEGTEFIIELPN